MVDKVDVKKHGASGFDSWNGLVIKDYDEDEYDTYVDSKGATKKCIHPLTFRPGVRALMIAAQMGLGKTEMSLKFIQNDPTIKRVLFVSSRRLQADDVLNRLGTHLPFQHYLHLKKDVDIKTVPFLIIQYESLYKLMATGDEILESYDLFLFDEARQVTGQSCSVETNHRNMKTNYRMLELLLSKISKRVILLDADLECDPMMYHVITKLFKPSECELRRYMKFNPMARSVTFLDEYTLWEKLMSHISEHGTETRIMMPFRSRKRLLDIKRIIEQDPELKILAVYDKCPSEDLEKLPDINVHMGTYNVFMFTSKITVGLDIQVPIQKVFAFCGSHTGCSALNMTQMLGRARHVEDTEMLMCVPKYKEDKNGNYNCPKVLSYDETLKNLKSDERSRQRYGDALMEEVHYDGGRFNFITTTHAKILACDKMMNDHPFEHNFIRLCCRKQWDIKDRCNTDLHAEAKIPIEDLDNETESLYTKLFQDVMNIDGSYWEDFTERVNTGIYAQNEGEMVDIMVILKRLGWLEHDDDKLKRLRDLFEHISTDEKGKKHPRGIKDLLRLRRKKNRHEIVRAALFQKYVDSGAEDIKKLDLAGLIGYGLPSNFCNMYHRDFRHIVAICKTLGLNSPSDFETTFSKNSINALRPLLVTVVPKPAKKKTRTLLNNLLKNAGLCVTPMESRIGADKEYEYTLDPIERVHRFVEFIDTAFVDRRVERIDKNIITDDIEPLDDTPMVPVDYKPLDHIPLAPKRQAGDEIIRPCKRVKIAIGTELFLQ
jgi:hypothetical protein